MRKLNLLLLAGVLAITLGIMTSPSAGWAAYGGWLSSISSGSLNQPAKVAVDKTNGTVYVTDAGNKMVKRYTRDVNTGAYTYDASFSLTVSGTPVGLAVTDEYIFVGDDTNDCVWVYNKNGAFDDCYYTGTTHKLDGLGSNWKIKMPNTIAVAPSGHIFVVDGDSDKVNMYNAAGGYAGTFGTSGLTSATDGGTTIYMYYPSGIAFGTSAANSPSNGFTTTTFYVGDQGNNRIKKLTYVYNTAQKYIYTMPTFSANIGTKVDSFGNFLRLSDLSYDSTYSYLLALDSLQMVAQELDASGTPLTPNAALNYNSGTGLVQTDLNVPTGITYDSVFKKFYVASNQSASVEVFSAQKGNSPTISITDPVSAQTWPCASTPTFYTVNFNGTDQDSGSETVDVYYYDQSTPSNKILIATKTPSVSGTNYNGSVTFDMVGVWPNYVKPATYKFYAEVRDTDGNTNNATSAGTVAITAVNGNYTCAQKTKLDPNGTSPDADNDGLTNDEEINGTRNTAFSNAPTDPNDPDSDHDGLADGLEEITYASNPNNVDTDGGGVSDGVEVAKGTNPAAGNSGDDLTSIQDLVGDYFVDGVQHFQTWIDITNPSTTTNAVVDLVFYNLNGSINLKAPAAYYLKPNQTVRFFPKATYDVSEGSVEIRTNVPALKADYVRARENALKYYSLDSGGSINFWRPADKASTLWSPTYNDGASRWRSWVYVKNWSDTPAHITTNFYDLSNPLQHLTWPTDYYTGVNPSGTQYHDGPATYVLNPHETVIINPLSVYGDWPNASGNPSMGAAAHYGQGFCEVFSDNATVTANMYTDRMNLQYYNAADPAYQCWDYSFLIPFSSVASTASYYPQMNTEVARYKPFLYIGNPNSSTLTGTVKFYNIFGTNVLTRNFSIAGHANGTYATVGSVDMGDGTGSQPMLAPTSPTATGAIAATVNTTSGSNIITYVLNVDNLVAKGLVKNLQMNIAGVTGTKRITNVTRTGPVSSNYTYTITLDSACDATVSNAVVTALNAFDQGTFQISTNLPHVAGMVTQRWNPTGLNKFSLVGTTFDYGYYTNTIQSTGTNTPYASSYYDNSEAQRLAQANTVDADSRLTAYMYVANLDDSNIATVTRTYYKSDGTPAKTGSITSGSNTLTMGTYTVYDSNGNPVTKHMADGLRIVNGSIPASVISIAGVTGYKTVTAVSGDNVTLDTPVNATATNAVVSIVIQLGPHKQFTFQPNNTTANAASTGDGGPVTGSLKLSADKPIAGYQLGQEYNYITTGTANIFFDYGFAKTYWDSAE